MCSDRGRVTQKDVARLAGVSTSSVSYVINNGPRSVSAETRRRVQQAVETLGYRPNEHARMLLRSRSNVEPCLREFGIIVGGPQSIFTRPFYSSILAGIYAEADRLHMRVRFLQFLAELRDPLLFNELIHREAISGLLFFAMDGDLGLPADEANALRATVVARVQERIAHVVCVERKWANLPAVTFDRAAAADLGVTHLVRLGHRTIAFAGAPDERLTGYRNALLRHGLDYDAALVVDEQSANTPEDGYRHAARLLRLPATPTAVFACSDEVSIGLLAGLQDAGLAAPGDIALVSCDDIPIAGYIRPRLTTVHIPTVEMGAYAVRMLRDLATHPQVPPVSVMLPIALVVRESCGASSSMHARHDLAQGEIPAQGRAASLMFRP
jgi:DNA-binding LacI/PurR family transcriptional regulator